MLWLCDYAQVRMMIALKVSLKLETIAIDQEAFRINWMFKYRAMENEIFRLFKVESKIA